MKTPAVKQGFFLVSSQQESNLYLEFRKFLFYPLNYGTLVLNLKYYSASHFCYTLSQFSMHLIFKIPASSTFQSNSFLIKELTFRKRSFPSCRDYFFSNLPNCSTLLLHTWSFSRIQFIQKPHQS